MNNLRLKPKNQDPQKEIQTIEDEYLILSVEFEARVFASEFDPEITYRSLFEEYRVKWRQWCEIIIKKFKYVHPDPEMFFHEYNPVV
jgi:hypothetical protein